MGCGTRRGWDGGHGEAWGDVGHRTWDMGGHGDLGWGLDMGHGTWGRHEGTPGDLGQGRGDRGHGKWGEGHGTGDVRHWGQGTWGDLVGGSGTLQG